MHTRCIAGDLAIIINAYHRINIGRIVKIIMPHNHMGDIVFQNEGFVWLVEASHPLTWTIGKQRFRRKRGPVPDSYLIPIRGNFHRTAAIHHQQPIESAFIGQH